MNRTEWMDQVDAILVNLIGLDHSDCYDYTWEDAFDSGSSPSEAVDAAIEYWNF
jgi:hypothetical protein